MKEPLILRQPLVRDFMPDQGAAAASSAAPTGFLRRLSARLVSWFTIPYGYEDETGFHYGHEPRPARLTVASVPIGPESWHLLTDRASEAIRYASALAPAPEETAAENRRVSV
jgi:hypothetical protein